MATMSSSLRIAVLIPVLAGLAHLEAYSQLDAMVFQQKAPQAQTREELFAFLDLMDIAPVDNFLVLGNEFIERFPKSEFLAFVHRLRMNAYRDMNDHKRAVQAAEKALELNPKDINVLLGLANLLPRQATGQSGVALSAAEGYSRLALNEIGALTAPRSVSLDDWEKTVSVMKASAHCALGTVALMRRRYSESVKELETCTNRNPAVDGGHYYILGMALRADGKPDQATIALKRAIELGPDAVKAQAEIQLKALKEN
jgi:tetratricopeptide (TPR) repeat protein